MTPVTYNMENACSICKSGDIERVPYDNHERRLNATALKHHLGSVLSKLGVVSQYIEDRLLFSPSQNILHCKACGYGRYERVFKQGALERYYGRRYFLAGGLPKAQWDDFSYIDQHPKTLGQWAFVSPWLAELPSIRMLDIGAAASRMSRMIKHHLGDRVQCSVIEPGDGWVDYYKHHNINLAGRFFPAECGRYDYIHTSHWLEHVEKLEPVLTAMRQSLNAGGLCFIEVPNCDTTYFERSFPDSPHIHFFTAASLTNAMRQHGFEALDVRECAMPNHVYYNYRLRTATLTAAEQHVAEITEASIVPVTGGNLLRGLFRAI